MQARDFPAIAVGYATEVTGGSVVACRSIRQQCQRFLDDLARQGDADFPFRFDHDKAARVCRFIEALPHSKGKWARGKETIRLEPWQVWVLACTFGWIGKADGLRRFRILFVVVPRKNGKSALSAGVALYMLCADGEFGAEVYAQAQAGRVIDATLTNEIRRLKEAKTAAIEAEQKRESDAKKTPSLGHQIETEQAATVLASAQRYNGLDEHGAAGKAGLEQLFSQAGKGSGTSDDILSWLSNGEFVMNAAATRKHLPMLKAMNDNRLPAFATGGLVGGMPDMPTSYPALPRADQLQSARQHVAVTAEVAIKPSPLFETQTRTIAQQTVGQAAGPIMGGAKAQTLKALRRQAHPGGYA